MSSELGLLSKDYESQGEDASSVDLYDNLSATSSFSTPKSSRSYRWKDIVLALLVACNLLSGVALWRKFEFMGLHTSSGLESTGDEHISPIVPPETGKVISIPVHWANEYSSATTAGMEEVDQNWDNIDASLGLVSISHELAAKHGLLGAMNDPRDRSKGIYTLEGYHSLHCLTVIRRTMFQLARGEKLDVPFGHSTHCFGALLQGILCNADTTLLYQKPGSGPGDGQMRECRNWPAMRDWAKEHSACMSTNSSGIAGQDIEGCDKIKAGDGLILSDWPEE
ncbi:hypothetical protein GGR53DRAFT_205466 [Hypoxylon sp. FL1150]|nr:hypothetical protein GGR53DRAFT_205466 [Hypoxylon sp. FL1150]